ncbi:MAG: 1-acyl-sn-glycerol-3-phosphate acyltransferase [Bacteroidetes bacterium]|nr:1-acyl-sn-glycerol-3-phosphate acyltransferase [Bacteroidota bacterium]
MQKTIIAIYRAFIAFSVMGTSGSLALLLRLVSFGRLIDFNRKYIVGPSSRFILFMVGIKLQKPLEKDFQKGQVLYTFNHNSYLDVVLVTALGLANTRFLLSENTYKYIPMTISALSIGVLYIPLKTNKERRLNFFEQLSLRAKEEGFSVFASSEGVHRFRHGISAFNKGIYHFATSLHLPIIPVYFHIPEEVNSLEGYVFKRGMVRIEILDKIETREWKLENLQSNMDGVRKIFIDKFNHEHKITT